MLTTVLPDITKFCLECGKCFQGMQVRKVGIANYETNLLNTEQTKFHHVAYYWATEKDMTSYQKNTLFVFYWLMISFFTHITLFQICNLHAYLSVFYKNLHQHKYLSIKMPLVINMANFSSWQTKSTVWCKMYASAETVYFSKGSQYL